jgi:hypothetical protein
MVSYLLPRFFFFVIPICFLLYKKDFSLERFGKRGLSVRKRRLSFYLHLFLDIPPGLRDGEPSLRCRMRIYRYWPRGFGIPADTERTFSEKSTKLGSYS